MKKNFQTKRALYIGRSFFLIVQIICEDCEWTCPSWQFQHNDKLVWYVSELIWWRLQMCLVTWNPAYVRVMVRAAKRWFLYEKWSCLLIQFSWSIVITYV